MTYLSRMGILGRLVIESSRPTPTVSPTQKLRPQPKAHPIAKATLTLKDGTTVHDILRGQGIKGRGTPKQVADAMNILERLREIEK